MSGQRLSLAGQESAKGTSDNCPHDELPEMLAAAGAPVAFNPIFGKTHSNSPNISNGIIYKRTSLIIAVEQPKLAKCYCPFV